MQIGRKGPGQYNKCFLIYNGVLKSENTSFYGIANANQIYTNLEITKF